MKKKYLVKIQVYLAFTVVLTMTVYATAALTGEFENHLVAVANERISKPFIVETILLNAFIFVIALIGNLARWWRNRHILPPAFPCPASENHEEDFLAAWLDEIPRATYLLGAVTSSVCFAIAIHLLCTGADYHEATQIASSGLILMFVFGAWGYFLDSLVSARWIRVLKAFILVIVVFVIAIAAPPLSIPIAVLAINGLRRQFDLD